MPPHIAYVFTEGLFGYDLGEAHPMNRKRLILAHKLFHELKFFDSEKSNMVLVSPKPANEESILTVHTKPYLDEVKRLSKEPGFRQEFGLGTSDCPVFSEMFETSILVSGATLAAGDLVLNGGFDYAFVVMGGLHHAFPAKASGFCYFNDLAVLIKQLTKSGLRVAYIDTDLHHGDGVQAIFWNDPNVLTISFHESGQFLFPGTGYPDETGGKGAEGTKVNFPLFKYTYDKLYLDSFRKYVPSIVAQFSPDIIVWQAGVDAHMKDPMGHLLLSGEAYIQITTIIKEITSRSSTKKMIMTGGGGYNLVNTARMWSLELATLAESRIPKMIPPAWVEFCHEAYQLDPPMLLSDSSLPLETIEGLYSMDPDRIITSHEIYRKNFVEELSKYYSLP